MARLNRGEHPKIDHINDLVATAKDDNSSDRARVDAMSELLSMFRPMLIKVCDKWVKYFNDQSHTLVSFEELMSDAEYWFMWYTKEKYIIDGDATYNKFIKDHIDQRIRYIYETHLKYYSQTIFPDPIRHIDENDGLDQLELVAYNYSTELQTKQHMDDEIIDRMEQDARHQLATRIMQLVENSELYTEREKYIFRETRYNGQSQDKVSKELGISRTRVVQISRKINKKLLNQMENDKEFWELITQTDIDFDNNLL